MMGNQSKYFRTATEDSLLSNADYKQWVDAYAQDNDLFFTNYAKAHVAISEQGHDNLMCEMGQEHQDGGYVEPSQFTAFVAYLNGETEVDECKKIYNHMNAEPVLEIEDDHH